MAVQRQPLKKFDPVNYCIYCNDRSDNLTDEHIVPFALGGNMVLPKSSCKKCAAKTSAYEGKTCQETLKYIRLRYGFPTRRPKKKPKTINIGTIEEQGRIGHKKIPVEEYAIGAFLLNCEHAGIRLGTPPDEDVFRHTVKCYPTDDLNKFKAKHNWDGKGTFRFHPVDYAQTIIKMCYSYVVAHIGTELFIPICTNYIVSTDKNVSYVFGQVGENEPKKGITAAWNFEICIEKVHEIAYIKCYFSMIPGMGTPIYEVFIGKIENEYQLQKILDALKENGAEIIAENTLGAT